MTPNPQSDLQLILPRVLLVTVLFDSQVGPEGDEDSRDTVTLRVGHSLCCLS